MKRIILILPLLLVFLGINGYAQFNPPQNFQCELNDGLLFTWEAPETGLPIGYNIYRNGESINPELITEIEYRWYGWYDVSCCPADYDIEAVYSEGISDQVINVFPEEIDPGVIEPVFQNGECINITVTEPPSALCGWNYLNIYYDDGLFSSIPAGTNWQYMLPIPLNTEVCYEYVYDECIARTCCVTIITASIEESPVPEITLFPQPATSNISFTSTTPIMEVEILNLTGEKINTFNLDGAKEWNTSINHLGAGIYIVRYVFENKDETFRKMIVR